MKGLAKDCIEWLKERELYVPFLAIAQGSTQDSNFGGLKIYELTIEEAYILISHQENDSGREKILGKIDSLIYFGFIIYSELDYTKIHNLNYDSNNGILDSDYSQATIEFEHNNPINDQTKIKLSKNQNSDVSGCFLYEQILKEKKNNELQSSLESAFKPIEDSYREYVDEAKIELEDKIKRIEDERIKSIEIISIFSAIIALLLSNIVGISNYTQFGVMGLIVINICIVLSIFFLLFFTRLLLKDKGKSSLIIALAIIIISIIILCKVIKYLGCKAI